MLRIILHFLSGIMIGGGAMLPGISGGVLAATFGLYGPLMELFTNPVRAVKKYALMFVPVLLGMAVGFYLSAAVLDTVFILWENYIICLFAGVIFGSLPSMLDNARQQGPISAKALGIMLGACFVSVASLMLLRGAQIGIKGSFPWFVFGGFVWALSIVVPGMNSSNILIFLGLYQQMNAGIKNIDISVILPMGLGLLFCVVLLARPISAMFNKYGTNMWCAVVGLVLGSAIMILPADMLGANFFLYFGLVSVGTVGAVFVNKLQNKIKTY